MCESRCVRSRSSSRISISISPFVVFIITSFAFLPSNSRASYSNKKIIWEYYSNWSTLSPNFDSNNSTFFSSSDFFYVSSCNLSLKRHACLKRGERSEKFLEGVEGVGSGRKKGKRHFLSLFWRGGTEFIFIPK